MQEGNHWKNRRILRLSRRSALGRVALVAAFTGAGAMLDACGKASRGAAPASPASGQASKPRPGGQLNVSYISDPQTFDPSTKLVAAVQILTETNNSLIAFKAGPGTAYDQLILQPALAERWELPEPSAYTFHLRKGVKFANLAPVNGRDFTAADVKFTYEYMSRTGALKDKKLPPATAAAMFAGLDRIETPDDSTVVVRFSQPFAPFLNYVSSQWVPILAHEIFDMDGNFANQTVGTGPFQLDMPSSQKGNRWVFKKNSSYFMQGRPYIDQVNHLIIRDQATINAAFQAKQLDILAYSGLDATTVNQVKKAVPDAVVDAYLDVGDPYDMYMNVSKPPLNDQRVRKAISLSIDRDAFIKTLSNGKGEWALAGGQHGLFTDAEMRKMLLHDPAQAKQLVAAAGFPNGLDFEFIYNAAYGQSFLSKAQLLQAQLKEGGINITLHGLVGGQEAQRRRSGDFVLAVTPRGQGISQEVDSYLYGMYYPGSGDNQGRVNDPTLTPLLSAQRQETDPAKRKEIIRQAVQLINTEPWGLALYYEQGFQVWHSYLKNYAPNVAYPYGDIVTQSWLEK